MKVSSQIHVAAFLPPWKETSVSIEYDAGRTSLDVWRRNNSLPVPEIEPRALGRPTPDVGKGAEI